MPKGKGYRAKDEIQAMRNEGVFSPSEIQEIERGGVAPGLGKLDNSTRSASIKGVLGKALGAASATEGLMTPSEIKSIESRGYKYFPDN